MPTVKHAQWTNTKNKKLRPHVFRVHPELQRLANKPQKESRIVKVSNYNNGNFVLFTSSFYLSVYLFMHCIYSFISYLVVAIEANEHVGSGGDSNLHHILPCALSCGFCILTQLAIKIHTNSNFFNTILTLGFPCNHHAISPVEG